MYVRNFVAANDGNISIRTGENEVWATPTRCFQGLYEQEDAGKVDLQGKVLEGTHKPSSELKMHLRAIRRIPICGRYVMRTADLHKLFHSGNSTGCSGSGRGRDYVGDVPIAPYAELGTKEVAEVIAPYCHTHNGYCLPITEPLPGQRMLMPRIIV